MNKNMKLLMCAVLLSAGVLKGGGGVSVSYGKEQSATELKQKTDWGFWDFYKLSIGCLAMLSWRRPDCTPSLAGAYMGVRLGGILSKYLPMKQGDILGVGMGGIIGGILGHQYMMPAILGLNAYTYGWASPVIMTSLGSLWGTLAFLYMGSKYSGLGALAGGILGSVIPPMESVVVPLALPVFDLASVCLLTNTVQDTSDAYIFAKRLDSIRIHCVSDAIKPIQDLIGTLDTFSTRLRQNLAIQKSIHDGAPISPQIQKQMGWKLDDPQRLKNEIDHFYQTLEQVKKDLNLTVPKGKSTLQVIKAFLLKQRKEWISEIDGVLKAISPSSLNEMRGGKRNAEWEAFEQNLKNQFEIRGKNLKKSFQKIQDTVSAYGKKSSTKKDPD